MPYELIIWERFIKLPINFNHEDIESEKVVHYNFIKDTDYFDGKKWKTQVKVNGENLPTTEGDGYDFVLANVPSGADFQNPVSIGQI